MFEYTPPENHLHDRVILITGAGAGIGRASAIAFAKAGATIILTGRTLSKLEAVYDEIESLGAPQPAIIPLNMESAASHDYDELATLIENEFGRLDGLLNNAGILGNRTPIEQYDPSTWNQVMQVNVNGPFMLTQSLIPLLRLSEDASIIFTSSGVGRTGRAYWGAYSVSKFATEGVMQVLADELVGNSNIRVNCINPGATRTAMRAYAYPGENPVTLATPEDIMPVYLYLMGKDSQAVNAQSLDAQ